MEISKLKKIIEKTLNQNKAKNIITISLKGKSSIADYMIIASGSSSKHIQSLSEILLTKIEKNGISIGKFLFKSKIDILAPLVPKSNPPKNLSGINYLI